MYQFQSTDRKKDIMRFGGFQKTESFARTIARAKSDRIKKSGMIK
jgi:hypothetical protein